MFCIGFVLFCFYLVNFGYSISNDELLRESNLSRSKIIELTDNNYLEYLNSPRDAYIVLLMTTNVTSLNCELCDELDAEFELMVTSWFTDHPDGHSNDASKATSSLFFAKATNADVRYVSKIFSTLKIRDVPKILLFMPVDRDEFIDGKSYIDQFNAIDIGSKKGIERAVDIVLKLRQQTGLTDMKIYEPLDKLNVILLGVLAFNVVFLYKRHAKLASILFRNRIAWAITTTGFISLMMSGYMYNKIKNSRYMGITDSGEISFFIPQEQMMQFGVETHIMVILHVLLMILSITLVVGVKFIKKLYRHRFIDRGHLIVSILSFLLAVLTYIAFAAFTSSYLIKSPSYPYPLPKMSSILKRFFKSE